jgi:sugar O-acyltransferase (sialic acid O-acetyltransferase NeuD family)
MSEPIQELYLFGGGGHAMVVLDQLTKLHHQKDIKIVVLDSADFREGQKNWPDIKLITQIEFEKMSFLDSSTSFHIAVGENSLRLRLAEVAVSKGLNPFGIIAQTAMVSPRAKLGEGIFVGPFAHVGPGAIVGDFSIVNTLANLEHGSRMGNFSHLAPGACVCGNATIGEGSFVGANAVVKENAALGSWSTLGALGYLNYVHLGQNSTLIGAPARTLGEVSG